MKGFFRYIGKQKKRKETASTMMSEMGATRRVRYLTLVLPWSSLATTLATPPNSQNQKSGTTRMMYHLL